MFFNLKSLFETFLLVLYVFHCHIILIKTQNTIQEGIIIDSLINLKETLESSISYSQSFLFNFNITNDINIPYIINIPNNKNIIFKSEKVFLLLKYIFFVNI